MFETSLVLALLLVLSTWGAYALRGNVTLVVSFLLWVPVLFVVHVAMALPAVGYLYLLLIACTVAARWKNLRTRWFVPCSLGCVLAAYAISIVEFIPVYREHQRLLASIPAVDLKPRLAYERRIHPVHTVKPTTTESSVPGGTTNSPQTEPVFDAKKLEQQESEFWWHRHDWDAMHRWRALRGLAQVHENFVSDFIAQPGLGVGRMMHYRVLREGDLHLEKGEYLLEEPTELLDQPPVELNPSQSASDFEGNLAGNSDPLPKAPQAAVVGASLALTEAQFTSFEGLNRRSVAIFAPPLSIGSVNSRLEARGFQSHAFHEDVEMNGFNEDHGTWTLARLELVSLLKHQPPAVYVSKHLPAMDELRDAPTRPPVAFETKAVAELYQGRDLVAEVQAEELRMVGAIRAIDECRNCHQVTRGALLGAFTYRFRQPKLPIPKEVGKNDE